MNRWEPCNGNILGLEEKFGFCMLTWSQSLGSDCKLLSSQCEDPLKICLNVVPSADRKTVTMRDDICWNGAWENTPCRQYAPEHTSFIFIHELFWTTIPFYFTLAFATLAIPTIAILTLSIYTMKKLRGCSWNQALMPSWLLKLPGYEPLQAHSPPAVPNLPLIRTSRASSPAAGVDDAGENPSLTTPLLCLTNFNYESFSSDAESYQKHTPIIIRPSRERK